MSRVAARPLRRREWPRGTGALLVLLAAACAGANETTDGRNGREARETVARFYDLVKAGDCAGARTLWPGYSADRCKENRVEGIARIETVQAVGDRALVYAKIRGARRDKPYNESGCVRLVRADGRWRIVELRAALCPADMTTGRHADRPAPMESRPTFDDKHLALERPAWTSPVLKRPLPADSLRTWSDPAKPSIGVYETVDRSGTAPVRPDGAAVRAGPGPAATAWGRIGTASGSFGSAAVLTACWTPEALQGSPTDRRIAGSLPPDASGPPEAAVQDAVDALPMLSSRLRDSIRSVEPRNPNAKLIALTFDLCEQADERTGYQAELIDLLRREAVHATFFAGGKWMRSHPEKTMQLLADPRFEVGNHTWTHGNLRVLRGPAMDTQIVWTQAQYRLLRDALAARPCAREAGAAELARIPLYPTTFRFPYGTCNRESLDAVAGYGLAAIQWSIVTGDPWKGQTADGIVRGVLNGIAGQRGAIVIAHANGRGWRTAEAMTRLIPALRERGYDFVTVSELLDAGEPQATPDCYETRPGDNARYDALFGRGTGERRR